MTILSFFKKKKPEPKLLIESKSPVCPLKVIIEECNNSTYMYLLHILNEHEPPIIKSSCWLCNHSQAPDDLDIKMMQDGLSSMLPAEFCKYPGGINSLNAEEIEIIWFEEGDGVGVLYKGEVLGIIPPWSQGTFPVFALGCIKESPLVLPLIKEENILWDRVLKAKKFWLNFDEEYWGKFQDESLSILESQFGALVKYYAIDGGLFPPKALVRFESKGVTYLITVGVSLVPQPMVETYADTPETKRRIEIALAIETNTFSKNEQAILQYISAQTALPWHNLSWLGHSHTISATDVFSPEFSNVVCIGANEYTRLPSIPFPSFDKDTTNVLWLLPVKEEEMTIIKNEGLESFCSKQNKNNFWVYKE